MAIKSKEILKSYFETGDKPTESQFRDLIDSLAHVSNTSSVNSNVIRFPKDNTITEESIGRLAMSTLNMQSNIVLKCVKLL